MKLKYVVGFLMLMPLLSLAEVKVETSTKTFNEITIQGESCEQDLRSLVIKFCSPNDDYLKEIHKDSFRMRTNAEDSLDEWHVYSDFFGQLYSLRRFTDFNDPREYGDYCYITITCQKEN